MNYRKGLNKIKTLVLLLSAIFVFTACGQSKVSNPEELNKLSLLNDKYGLVQAEPIGGQNEPEMASLFLADVMNVSVFNSLKPEKEIIIKILSDDSEEEALKNMFLLKLRTDEEVGDIVKSYEGLQMITYAEPNYTVELGETAAVPRVKKKKIIRLQEEKEENKTIIAVIDSGVDTSHKILIGKTVPGWDFIANSGTVSDNFGHGTHVAGIIINNSSYTKIMPIRFTDGKEGKLSNLIKGIKYAVDNNAQVINLSLGLEEQTKTLKEAIDYAEKKNVIVVAAAGNNNSKKQFYPAAYDGVFAVAALNNKEEKLYQSNYGSWVDYSTKAQDIYSTLPGNKYGYKTGTSQAAPFLSATIADILNLKPGTGPETITKELEKSSVPVSKGTYSGLLGRELIQ